MEESKQIELVSSINNNIDEYLKSLNKEDVDWLIKNVKHFGVSDAENKEKLEKYEKILSMITPMLSYGDDSGFPILGKFVNYLGLSYNSNIQCCIINKIHKFSGIKDEKSSDYPNACFF